MIDLIYNQPFAIPRKLKPMIRNDVFTYMVVIFKDGGPLEMGGILIQNMKTSTAENWAITKTFRHLRNLLIPITRKTNDSNQRAILKLGGNLENVRFLGGPRKALNFDNVVHIWWKFPTDRPASILYKSTAGRYRPVSYPNGPITARCRFIKNAYSALQGGSYVTFVLSLFVPHLSLFWCLQKAVLPDCGVSWVSSLIGLSARLA